MKTGIISHNVATQFICDRYIDGSVNANASQESRVACLALAVGYSLFTITLQKYAIAYNRYPLTSINPRSSRRKSGFYIFHYEQREMDATKQAKSTIEASEFRQLINKTKVIHDVCHVLLFTFDSTALCYADWVR